MNKKQNRRQDGENNIEVWEDLVHIKDLVLSIGVCTVITLGAYLLAPNEPPKPLIYGLVGAVVGFVISSIVIKPKRRLRFAEEKEE